VRTPRKNEEQEREKNIELLLDGKTPCVKERLLEGPLEIITFVPKHEILYVEGLCNERVRIAEEIVWEEEKVCSNGGCGQHDSDCRKQPTKSRVYEICYGRLA
jgi:hypothetical protein